MSDSRGSDTLARDMQATNHAIEGESLARGSTASTRSRQQAVQANCSGGDTLACGNRSSLVVGCRLGQGSRYHPPPPSPKLLLSVLLLCAGIHSKRMSFRRAASNASIAKKRASNAAELVKAPASTPPALPFSDAELAALSHAPTRTHEELPLPPSTRHALAVATRPPSPSSSSSDRRARPAPSGIDDRHRHLSWRHKGREGLTMVAAQN